MFAATKSEIFGNWRENSATHILSHRCPFFCFSKDSCPAKVSKKKLRKWTENHISAKISFLLLRTHFKKSSAFLLQFFGKSVANSATDLFGR
jgi:hypothetical protein